MTLTKTTFAAIISVALLAGVSTTALAQNGNRANMTNAQGTHQGMGYQHGNRANLTPEQQAVSQKAFDEFQLKTADLRQQLMSKQYEYQALLTSKPLDEQKVLAVSKEITALRDNLYQQRVALDTDLAKAGVPMMGHGMGGAGMHGGRGCR
ncbi:periplasmic heavy metal sensor [Serratia fonticola]|uniref:periplasmic heavy metal sensor n=1 Tax=Serratia TaxID=613 RepID=UPI000BA28ABD|nr:MULTISPECIES: periplasmic heavy metal sensor [Serratia]MBP1019114.1 periplasmic heavy metal sensor [Serratia fonticola]MBP1036314.1 periplasmic heavy metal sensor [Serratia fonticola]PAA95252.1 zinc resistance protein [Serratia fonticola]QXN63129.1 periplasmic heavy metal sensor [Serratia fonticola]UAN58601.1 periplasmic heavy metal sensor [Serratia sp. JSRIV004]